MIGFYMRTSLPTGDDKNSIVNQRRILQEYVTNKELNPADDIILEYIDDGISGACRNRPAFRKMIEDCKRGKIHILLVKDLSRLGRDYLEVEEHLERIFPTLGVTFISVVNGFNSSKMVDGTLDVVTSITNVANTYYLADLSRKSKTAIRARWKKGILTSSNTPLGYICEDLKKGWQVDPDGKEIVRKVFDLALSGYKTGEIAEQLNSEGVLTPYRYLKTIDRQNGIPASPDELLVWDGSMVGRILRQEQYTGVLIQGKTTSIAPGKGIIKRTDPEKQFRHEKHHEAIVTREEFEKAQAAISRKGSGPKQNNGPRWMFTGLVRCGTCGRMLQFQSSRKAACPRNGCGCRVEVAELEGTVREAIEEKRAECREKLDEMEPADVKALEAELKELNDMMLQSYEEYVEGRYSVEEFQRDKEMLGKKTDKLKKQIRWEKNRKMLQDDQIADLKEFLGMTDGELTREMALSVIESITAGEETEVQFKRV